jgi:carboxyl-terminal processing protease
MLLGFSVRRALAGVLVAAVSLLSIAGTALAQPDRLATAPAAGAASASDVSDRVWSRALARGADADADLVFDPIRAIPADASDAALARLRSLPALYDQNRAKQQAARQDRIDALGKELDEALAKPPSPRNLSAALKSAVELSMIVPDRDALLAEGRITSLVDAAARAARQAEDAADWLQANELFFRLNLLLEEQGTFKADVKRLSHRVSLLRIFVPQRLWELRNAARLADDKPPLPPFNALGEDYRTKVRGITREIVVAAIERAVREHVDRAQRQRRDLLVGGLEFIRTMVSTPDLEAVFPAMADPDARRRMLDHVDRAERELAAVPGPLDPARTRSTLAALLRVNDETVRIAEPALLHEFGEGAMACLDEFSAIIWPDDLARFERMYQGRLKGVGVQIQMDETSQMIKVVTPLEGTPAQRAGVRAGDLIKKIDGRSAVGISLNQAVELITGPPGTTVVITMERDGQEIDFELTRKVIPLRSVKGWRRTGPRDDQWDYFIDPESRIGYVRILQFSEDTTRELAEAVRDMKERGLAGLIVDLRFNPGGLLTQAVSVANFFIDRGTIVSTTGDNATERAEPGRARLKGIPIAMLINEGSASASEIVSGAVRDYADKGDIRAVLVGDRSFGKGSVQNVFDLGDNAQMKLTTQYYRLPGGQIIHRLQGAKDWGVDPHVKCFMLPDQISQALTLRQDADVVQIDQSGKALADANRPDPQRLITEGIDLQLQYALVLLQTQTVAPRVEQVRAADPPVPDGAATASRERGS